jgi:hypothetical protein
MAEATLAVDEASEALATGRQNLLDSVLQVSRSEEALATSEYVLNETTTARSEAQSAYDVAQQELADAQYNYDNNLIPDPQQPDTTPIPGLRVDIYNRIDSARTPIPPRSTNYNLCKTVTYTQINNNWGGGNVDGCGSDYVMLHYTGYLTVPETTPYGYDFLNIADDGWYMTLDGTVVNDNWVLKGCGGWWSAKQHLEAGRSYAIDAWYYEWGGGACSTLYYDNGYTWGVIPASWFSQNPVVPISYIHDPALLLILEQKQNTFDLAAASLSDAQFEYASASSSYESAVQAYDQAVQAKAQAEEIIPSLELNLQNALDIRDSIQPYIPYIEPEPTPEPEPTTEPEPEPEPEPTPEPTVEPVPPTTEEVLDELWAEATEDDIVIAEELANIPVLGSAIVALADAINFVGNVGADMTPEVREQSEKVVVSAIIVTQVATQAAATATLAASSSASVSGSASSAGRRIK